jgi:hypothetical protein
MIEHNILGVKENFSLLGDFPADGFLGKFYHIGRLKSPLGGHAASPRHLGASA